MSAREVSLRSAILIYKYVFGLAFAGIGIFLFTRPHLLLSDFIAAGFFVLASFFLSVARIKLEPQEIRYRRLFQWHAIVYSDVLECGESWVFGHIKARRYVFPWGRIYFSRPQSSESSFGWDQKIIAEIRAQSHLLERR